MTFEVVGLSKTDNLTGEVKLEFKHPEVIYQSLAFLKVPLAELSQYRFGDKYELMLVTG